MCPQTRIVVLVNRMNTFDGKGGVEDCWENEIRKTRVRFSWASTILLKKENFHSVARSGEPPAVSFFLF